MALWAMYALKDPVVGASPGGRPAGTDASPCTPREMMSTKNSATQVRCPTTSRTSHRSQALGRCQASGGSVCRECVSRSDSEWISCTRVSGVSILLFLLLLCRTHPVGPAQRSHGGMGG